MGVMSDSHDNIRNARRAAGIFARENVDLVIHLGDIIAPFTLKAIKQELGDIPLTAIYGNNCGEKLGLQKTASQLGVRLAEPPLELEAGGKRILLLHGFGSPEVTRKIVYALAVSREWDLVLYGHTHERDEKRINGVLIINPGETAGALKSPSIAIIDLDSLTVRFVDLA